MKKNLKRMFALFLTLTMILPLAAPVIPAGAEETITEETAAEETIAELATQTETISAESSGLTKTKAWDFSDESQLADFSLYQSGANTFTVADGLLAPDGTDGEMKAILSETPANLQSVSVDILPGESDTIYAGLYFGASGAGAAQDEITSQVFLIKSDYDPAVWPDAINRIDVVQGEFNGGWKHINTVVSETGNGNALFSGAKQALNLKLVFGGDVVLLTLSLVSDSSKYIQLMYEIDADLAGQIGLRVISSDTVFDNLRITYSEPLPDGCTAYDFEQSTQLSAFTLYQPAVYGGRMYAKATGSSKTFWEAVLNKDYTGIQSVSVNMYNSDTTRFFGGFFVGGTDKNLDIGFGCRRGNKTRNEIRVHTGTGHLTARTDAAGVEYAGYNYFTSKFNPINLTLTFESDKIIAKSVLLDDETKVLTYEYAWDPSTFTGEIGLVSDNSNLSFDELVITYGDGQVDTYNFDDHAQQEDFTFYTPLKSNCYISNGTLIATDTGTGELGTRAILSDKFYDVTTISVDITGLNTTRAFAGIYLGGQEYGWAIQCGNRRGSNRTRGEIVFKEGADYTQAFVEKKAFEYHQEGGTYGFFSDLANQGVNLALQLSEDKIVATMTRLDDPTVTLTGEYAWDASLFNGTIGLTSDRSSLAFDNLTITRKSDVTTQNATETVYLNDGYNFLETDRWSWETTKPVLEAPYTMEAWVKIPKGTSDSKTAYIIDNTAVPPYLSLRLATYGQPNFVFAQEGESAYSFTADVDLRTGKWTHVAYTYDLTADQVTCYINGVAVEVWEEVGLKSIEFNSTIAPHNPYVIGATRNNEKVPTSVKFPGWISDVRLWNRALTADELADSMMTQYTQPREGLMLNLPLNTLVDDQFEDLSGNENHVAETNYKALEWVEDQSEPGAYSMVVVPDH